MIDNRLTVSLDYYVKKTSDMLVPANWSALAGGAKFPNINIGDMQNNGFDVSVGWKQTKSKFSYGIIANVTHYKNKVLRLGSSDIFNGTYHFNNITKTTVNQPIGMYYGYNVLGVYSSDEDVLGYTTDGQTVLPFGVSQLSNLNPTDFVGRLKFEDVNGDGIINGKDQTIIGNPHPDLTGGLNINAGYGNWDLSSYLYFSLGNDLFKHYMSFTHYSLWGGAYSIDRRDNSWSPENPDGIYPMWVGTANEPP
jgi:hypothetical protein